MGVFDSKAVKEAGGTSGYKYEVMQVTLEEALVGTGSKEKSLTTLEDAINLQASKGYHLHTITMTASGKGPMGGARLQAICVFEKID